MDPTLIRLTGTGLEVLGTFFLSVEAIKLHNFRFLREKVLKLATLKMNPIIQFVDTKTDDEQKQAGEAWLNILFGFFILLGLSIIYVFLRLLGSGLGHIWAAFSGFIPGPTWVDIIAALPVAFVFLLLAGAVGTSSYTLVVLVLNAAIAALYFVERHTATGIIGILGFLLFLTGAAMKAYLDWKGA
jgi:hypothetical protein